MNLPPPSKPPAKPDTTTAQLRILQTTDLHVNVLAYDYYVDKPRDTMGFTRTASLIEMARSEVSNTLLLDNGDFLQGSPMGDLEAREGAANTQIHPMIAAMNLMGYDGATLGNHEFNYGLEYLFAKLDGARFPILCANLIREKGASPTEDDTVFPPYQILTRTLRTAAGDQVSIRIGLLGLVPPQITIWDRRNLEGRVHTRKMIETALAFVPQMKAEGADIIVVLNHSGIDGAQYAPDLENVGLHLAAIDGIDVVLCGHQHQLFPGPAYADIEGVDAIAGTLHGKPAVMAGFWGSHLGVIDLALERCAQGGWTVQTHKTHLRPIYDRDDEGAITPLVSDHRAVSDLVAGNHTATLDFARRPVGRSAQPIHSYFSLIGDDPSVQVVAQAQLWRCAQLLAGTEFAHLPLLSAAAPFKSGGIAGPDNYTDVTAGPLSLRNLADLYQFPNTLCAVRVTGAEILDWLERAAGQFNQIVPGAPEQNLHNPGFPSYNFDIIHGLCYEIDLSQPSRFGSGGVMQNPAAHRIKALTWQGQPVAPEQVFIVATNSYRAGGGGAFAGANGSSVILSVPETNFDVLTRYVETMGTLNPMIVPTWRFAPLPGMTALFDTSPRAFAYLAGLRDRRIEPVGRTKEGFARFRLHL